MPKVSFDMSTKKKIIIIGPAFPYRGGNALFVSHVYEALKNDFNIKIFNYSLLYPSFLFPGKTQFDESATILKKAPSERVVNSINPFSWIKTAKKIIKENPDLVIFDWWHPFFSFCHFAITELIKKKFNKKIVFITENFISHEGNFIDRFLTLVGLKNASAFLVLSSNVEKDVSRIAKGRNVYKSELPIYDCYEIDESISAAAVKNQIGLNDKDRVLLFFGYVRKYKGLDLLIQALPLIKSSIANLKLLIVGEFYDSIQSYVDLIKKYNLENDTIIINQFIPNEEVGKYYKISDLVVLPYRSATQSGILNVAYGFSKPVVVTNVGGLSEFVEQKKTGIVVEPNSPNEIAKGIIEFFYLKNSVNFEHNIQELVKKNSFEKLPELFFQIISDTHK